MANLGRWTHDLSEPAQNAIRLYTSLISSGQRSKNDLKEFERILVACDEHDVSALVLSEELWAMLREHLAQYDNTWDVTGMLLNRFSLEKEGRQEAQESGFTAQLGDILATKGRIARADKNIERLGSMTCILALLSVDASEANVAQWCPKICISVKDALERSQTKNGAVMEAYSMLSIFIKLLYTGTGTQLATRIASTFVKAIAGGVQLLFNVAKRGLVDETSMTGAPKIVAEKSLVVLAKLNADASDTNFVPNQLDPNKLGNFLVKCARDCSWVQSQDIAMTFLARLILHQHHLPMDFLSRPEVLDMLKHILSSKSTALKITGVAFISMCPASVFYPMAGDFEQALNILADSPARTLKMVIWEAGRGIWGIPSPISGPSAHALQNSEFLHHAADSVPAVLPRCLWELLPIATQQLVAASQGITLGSDEEDDDLETRPGQSHKMQTQGARQKEVLEKPSPSGHLGHVQGETRRTSPTPAASLPSSSVPTFRGISGDQQICQPGVRVSGRGQSLSPSPMDIDRKIDGEKLSGMRLEEQTAGPVNGGDQSSGPSRLQAEVGSLHLEEPLASRPKPTIRIKKSTPESQVDMQAVLALQQLQEVVGGTKRASGGLDVGPSQEGPVERSAGGTKRRVSSMGLSHPTSVGGGSGSVAVAGHDDEDVTMKKARQRKGGSSSHVPVEKDPLSCGPVPSSVPPRRGAPSAATVGPRFGVQDIRSINDLIDSLYHLRQKLGPRGPALIKNMAEGAANISTIVYLRTYRLPAAVSEGLDDRLAVLKARALLVYNGVMDEEPLDLLLPFSELLSAESGIMRRNMESIATSAGVPFTSTEAAPRFYNGGEGVRYSLY